MELLIAFFIAVGLNILLFIPAYLFKTDKLTDISYALTFGVVGLYGLYLQPWHAPRLLLFVMVAVWAVRLGVYLLIRIQTMGRDKRFDDKRDNFLKFLQFWFFQGATVFVVLLPSLFLWSQSIRIISWVSIIGVVIWAIGLLIEWVADYQKFRFMQIPADSRAWIDEGLWRYSRHPNYLGEMLVWIGVYLYVAPLLIWWQAVVAVVGPAYIVSILLFVSGIPLLERSADKRWGTSSEYQQYKRRTPVLLPGIHFPDWWSK